MPYDQTMPVPNQNPQAQRQGTNAPPQGNPQLTTPFSRPPQQPGGYDQTMPYPGKDYGQMQPQPMQPMSQANPQRSPVWQGPPTLSGLPEGRQAQPLQPGAMGPSSRQLNNNPQAPQMVGGWQPSTAGGGTGVGYANGAPLLGGSQGGGGVGMVGGPAQFGGSNVTQGSPQFGGSNVTQGSPQYQGFENGFQPQGEWGNAMGSPGGGGPNSMTLEGVPGYTGNDVPVPTAPSPQPGGYNPGGATSGGWGGGALMTPTGSPEGWWAPDPNPQNFSSIDETGGGGY